jgi:hypothetical protein
MDKVILKVESSIELIEAISHYYEEFEQLLTDKSQAKDLTEKIRSTIKSSRDKLLKRLAAFKSQAISELNLIETTTLVFQTYQLIKEYDTLIESIIEQISEWNVFVRPDLITSDISQTRLLGLSKESNMIVNLLTNFKRKYEEFDISLVKVMTDYILNKIKFAFNDNTGNPPTSLSFNELKEIQKLFHKYPLAIDIYSVMLQTVMDQTKPLITPILQMIEEDKSFILSDYESRYTSDTHKIKLVQNPSLRAFGLIPADIAKPIDKLFESVELKNLVSSSKTPEALFEKLAKQESCGVIYIKKITAQPIEFSIWKLIRVEDAAQYIKESHSGQGVGLSKGLVERMKVINYIEPPEKSKKWALSEYHVIGDYKSAETFYVIDSFNGKTYRFIRPWVDKSNRIPRSYLNGLLTFLNIGYNVHFDEVKSRNNKDRIAIYNEIQESVILHNVFLKQPIDVEGLMADVQADMDAPRLKQEVALTLSKFITTQKLSNWSEFGSAIHNVELLDLFADQLVKLYPTYFKDELIDDPRVQFPFSETLSTFLVELNNVKKSFGRTMHEKFIKTPRDQKDLAFKSKDNTQIFVNKFVRDSLDEVITNKSNVYSSLLMKNKILTIELTENDVSKAVVGGYNGVPKYDSHSFYPKGEGVDDEIYD